jgi:hypothetical protein
MLYITLQDSSVQVVTVLSIAVSGRVAMGEVCQRHLAALSTHNIRHGLGSVRLIVVCKRTFIRAFKLRAVLSWCPSNWHMFFFTIIIKYFKKFL